MRAKDIRYIKLYSQRTVVVLVLSLVTFVFLRGAVRMYERYAAASEARTAAVAEAAALMERQATLKERIGTLSSDRGIEEELRRRYGVAREGEGVIELLAEVPQSVPPAQESGWFGWLKRVF